MAGLSSPGIGSGLDVTGIVTGLVQSEKVPFDARIAQQEEQATAKITAFGSLVSAVSAFEDAAKKLNDANNFELNKISPTSNEFFSTSVTSEAAPGSFKVEVVSIAQGQKLTSGGYAETDTVGSGTMSLTVNGSTLDLTLDGTETLRDLKDKINEADGNPGVTASIVTDNDGQHLVFTSDDIGLDNAITIAVADSDGNDTDNLGLSKFAFNGVDTADMQQTQEPKDAEILIDNFLRVTQSSNLFTNAIEGVSINVLKANDVGDNNAITVSQDKSQVGEALAEFASSYNKFLETSISLGRVNTDSKIVGKLVGESLLRSLTAQVKNILSSADSSSGLSLAALGITTNRDGTLDVDEKVLKEGVDNNFDAVKDLFVGDNSVMGKLTDTLKGYTGGDGLIQVKIDSYKTSLDRLEDERAKFAEKMTALENRLFSQFNAMDLLVGQLNSTGSYLAAQLENLPGVVRKD
ncbi:flagellar filament capping protein FliD [Psychrosphaera aestuarii]|uniref:flagellar filament capping protein FliD n=1 Tax=Psychrosphaera aestuarii TaxID=1266052 RepID=UPI001B338130|nr:flagellar filament capping protein FliD [Psychrosphaera aestuarii]